MKATNLLNEAIATQAQRAADHNYGEEGERTSAHVARIVNAITGRNLQERDIWIVMLALKLARNECAPGSVDTLIDMVSYASLLGECDIAGELARLNEEQVNTDRAQFQSLGGVGSYHAGDVSGRIVTHDSDREVPPGYTERAAAAYQEQQDDGWNLWRGKDPAGPASMSGGFYVKYRSGDVSETPHSRSHFDWSHNGGFADIVAWKPA